MALSLSYAHGITVIPFNGLHYPLPQPPKNSQMKTQWGVRVRGLGSEAMTLKRKKRQQQTREAKWQWLKPMKWLGRSWLSPHLSVTSVLWLKWKPGRCCQAAYVHTDNCLKTSRFVFEKERWNVIKTKNSEVVLINLFYIKVYKTLINKRLDLSLTVCHALRPSSCLCSSNSAPLSIYLRDLTLMSWVLK